MRPLEALFLGAVFIALLLRWIKPRNRQFTATTMAMLGIFLGLHLAFDRARWEMIPTYAMAAAAAWIFSSDLRRVSGAKAGESSRWMAIPSVGARVASGLVLGVVAIVALGIPLWAFPRIVLPEPDGLYDVGRVDVTLADSSRPLPSGAPLPIAVSVWYPAEAPNGAALRYHPHPGALGSYLAIGNTLPGFAFRNLTATRTHSTSSPRFSIREGRSPLVVVAHDTGASRMQGTALYERLASRGYVVASIDHGGAPASPTGEDGTLRTWPASASDRDAARDIQRRITDLRLVIDRLTRLPEGSPLDSLATHIRVDRVAVIGTGLGATAAAEAAVVDPRVTAGIGLVFDTLAAGAARGVRRPFLAFTVRDQGDLLDDLFRYGGTEVRLDGASERTLSDVALLGEPVVRLLGIESGDAPADVHGGVSALTLRFLDQYLKERREETEVNLPARVRLRVIPHRARS
jgi:predicted dienelactone hydrolase